MDKSYMRTQDTLPTADRSPNRKNMRGANTLKKEHKDSKKAQDYARSKYLNKTHKAIAHLTDHRSRSIKNETNHLRTAERLRSSDPHGAGYKELVHLIDHTTTITHK